MTKNQKISLIVLSLVVILALVVWGITSQNSDNPLVGQNNNQDNNVSDSPDDLDQGNDGVSTLPNVIFSLNGQIKDISTDSITIESEGLHTEDQSPVDVRVIITEDKFEYVGEEGDEERMFIPGTVFLSNNGGEITFSDLEIGEFVSVESRENIRDKTEFEASTIKTN